MRRQRSLSLPLTGSIVLIFLSALAAAESSPLAVCATSPDLGSLLASVGGERVDVTVFAAGPQDPHYLEARPSFVKALHGADMYVQVGLELEVGWTPALLRAARNPRVLPASPGYVDASTVVPPLEIPTGSVDRSMGDVHPLGNPHYLLEPLNGLKVAALLRDRLSDLRPEAKPYFGEKYAAFEQKLLVSLLGEALLKRYGEAEVPKLVLLLERGGLERFLSFLETQGQRTLLGGWLGRLAPYARTKVVADHNLWPYFARRFGLSVIGFLEPKPGIAPTTRHLGALVEKMKAEGVRIVLAAPYFNPRHARFISEHTGAKVLAMAHQTGARDGTESYLDMLDYNVRQLAVALEGER